MSLNVNQLDQVVYVITNEDNEIYVTTIPNIGQAAIQFQDEGANVGTPGVVNTIDFVGSNVSLGILNGKLTVTISGSGGGGTGDISGTGTINEVAYFTAAKTIASLPVATYPNLTELSYIKGLRGRPRFILSTSTTTASVTGTTNQTALFSFLIPAETIQPNDQIYFKAYFTKVGTAAAVTYRIQVNTSDAIGGTTIASFAGGATVLFIPIIRTLIIKSAVNSQQHFGQNASTDEATSTSGVLSTASINFAVNQYVIFSAQLVNSADTVSLNAIQAELIK